MFRIFLKLHFFRVWGHYDLGYNGFNNKKSNAYHIRFFTLKLLHCKEIFLSESFLLKIESAKLAIVTSSIKAFHVYRRSPNIGEKLKCVLEERNRHSNAAIKIVGDADETIGHIPDGLSKVVAPTLKKEIVISVEAEVTGHPRENGR